MIAVELGEWDRVDPGRDARLRGLRLSAPTARQMARELTETRVVEIQGREDGLEVRSFSHVGRIELDGLSLTIRPKLAPDALLDLLKYAYTLQDLRLLDEAQFKAGAHGLQDLLIAQLESEARELLRRGITRRYVRVQEDLSSPRGRLAVSEFARRQGKMTLAVPCAHHPRSTDFSLNRVVAGGLELAQRLAVAPLLRSALAHTRSLFADVARSAPLSTEGLRDAQRSLDRLTMHYAPLCRLIEILHTGSTLDLSRGERTMRVKGFLFDMNRFFQTLLSKFLGESLPDCRVQEEISLRGMMRCVPQQNPRGRRAPQPRPDFMVVRGGQRILLDAKYRDLWRHELPREMLYQLAIYAMSQPAGATAAILYPTADPTAREAVIQIDEPLGGSVRAYVALRPVVIPKLLELVKYSRPGSQEREAFARELAFGYG